jgi:hypothetical protein
MLHLGHGVNKRSCPSDAAMRQFDVSPGWFGKSLLIGRYFAPFCLAFFLASPWERSQALTQTTDSRRKPNSSCSF